MLGYLIDPDEAALDRTLERFAHQPRAPCRGDGATRCASSASSSTRLACSTSGAEGKIDRPPAPGPGGRQRSRQPGAAQDEELLDPTAFLVAYLIEGKPAFRDREAPSVEEAIELIHGAGGVAVWAHPFWDVKDPGGVLAAIDRFRAPGWTASSRFYVTHTREQTELLVERCAELGLLSTGSSDFHGPEHHTFSRFRAFDTYGLGPTLGPLAGCDEAAVDRGRTTATTFDPRAGRSVPDCGHTAGSPARRGRRTLDDQLAAALGRAGDHERPLGRLDDEHSLTGLER